MSLATRIAGDRSIFLDDHGEPVSYTHAAVTTTISVLWDENFRAIDPDTGNPVESSGPAATARTVDVPTVAQRDTLVKDSATYYIIGIHPDGQGYTSLVLSKD